MLHALLGFVLQRIRSFKGPGLGDVGLAVPRKRAALREAPKDRAE